MLLKFWLKLAFRARIFAEIEQLSKDVVLLANNLSIKNKKNGHKSLIRIQFINVIH